MHAGKRLAAVVVGPDADGPRAEVARKNKNVFHEAWRAVGQRADKAATERSHQQYVHSDTRMLSDLAAENFSPITVDYFFFFLETQVSFEMEKNQSSSKAVRSLGGVLKAAKVRLGEGERQH